MICFGGSQFAHLDEAEKIRSTNLREEWVDAPNPNITATVLNVPPNDWVGDGVEVEEAKALVREVRSRLEASGMLSEP